MRDANLSRAIRRRAVALAETTIRILTDPGHDGRPAVTVHADDVAELLTEIFVAVLAGPADLLHGEQPREGEVK